jgi:hypothetical protein
MAARRPCGPPGRRRIVLGRCRAFCRRGHDQPVYPTPPCRAIANRHLCAATSHVRSYLEGIAPSRPYPRLRILVRIVVEVRPRHRPARPSRRFCCITLHTPANQQEQRRHNAQQHYDKHAQDHQASPSFSHRQRRQVDGSWVARPVCPVLRSGAPQSVARIDRNAGYLLAEPGARRVHAYLPGELSPLWATPTPKHRLRRSRQRNAGAARPHQATLRRSVPEFSRPESTFLELYSYPSGERHGLHPGVMKVQLSSVSSAQHYDGLRGGRGRS